MKAGLATAESSPLAISHLLKVQADLLDAKVNLLFKLQALISHLPADDPDKQVLEASNRDLMASIYVHQQAVLTAGALAMTLPQLDGEYRSCWRSSL